MRLVPHQDTLISPGYGDASACTPFPDPSHSVDPGQALYATVLILPTAPALGADPLGSLPRAKNSENSEGGGQPSSKQVSELILGPTQHFYSQPGTRLILLGEKPRQAGAKAKVLFHSIAALEKQP